MLIDKLVELPGNFMPAGCKIATFIYQFRFLMLASPGPLDL